MGTRLFFVWVYSGNCKAGPGAIADHVKHTAKRLSGGNARFVLRLFFIAGGP